MITIFPQPRRKTFKRESVSFAKARWISISPGFSCRLIKHITKFKDAVRGQFLYPLQVSAADPQQGQIFLKIRMDKGASIKPEGYKIAANQNGIVLSASDEAGVFYGLQTLHQIIVQAGSRLPAFEITDFPDFPHRGVMLDVSRCKVPTMETLFKTVDLMARLKLNHLQLYMEHTFAFSAHRTVWQDASPFTSEEILELDAYCKDQYIELVPNFNSFGHFERWLRHSGYKNLAECPDGFKTPHGFSDYGTVLRPSKKTLRFLDSLYKEILPNFSSKYFNVGCDETTELGKGWSRKLCKDKGVTRVYLDFLLEISKLVQKHGRTMMFWGDIIIKKPELVRELPKNIVALEWGYEAGHPFDSHGRIFKTSRIPFWVCPGTSSWNSLVGRTTNCLKNLANAAHNGIRHGAIGFLNTDWGDDGHHQYLPISYPGIFAGAAFSWCLKSNRGSDIAKAMNELVFLDDSQILGNLILDLGRTYEMVSKPFNRTVFNRLLFSHPDDKKVLKGITIANLKKCLKSFDKIEEKLSTAQPKAPDGELVKSELSNAIAMARLGVRRGLASLNEKYCDRELLISELRNIITRHEELWLSRNRPGGLSESSGRLRSLLAELS